MKRIVLTLILLLATSSVASAQFAQSKENLRGLTGVRLIVMYHRADGLDEAQRPEVLLHVRLRAGSVLRGVLLRLSGGVLSHVTMRGSCTAGSHGRRRVRGRLR